MTETAFYVLWTMRERAAGHRHYSGPFGTEQDARQAAANMLDIHPRRRLVDIVTSVDGAEA